MLIHLGRNKYFLKDAGLVELPSGVHRGTNQWRVVLSVDGKYIPFRDSCCGGPLGALRTAIKKFIELNKPPLSKTRKININEWRTKNTLTGMPGVYSNNDTVEVTTPLGEYRRAPESVACQHKAMEWAKAVREQGIEEYIQHYQIDMRYLKKQLRLRA